MRIQLPGQVKGRTKLWDKPRDLSIVMTQEQVLRWLRLVLRDRWYRQEVCFNFSALERMNLFSRSALTRARRGNHGEIWGHMYAGITDEMCRLLTPVIAAIESGLLVFTARRPHKAALAIWLDVPTILPLPQDSIILDEAWCYWSRCRRCGGARWLPIDLEDKSQVACYQCHPPEQWPSFGAAPRVDRLVERTLSAYFERYGVTHEDFEIRTPFERDTPNLDLPQLQVQTDVRRVGTEPGMSLLWVREGTVVPPWWTSWHQSARHRPDPAPRR